MSRGVTFISAVQLVGASSGDAHSIETMSCSEGTVSRGLLKRAMRASQVEAQFIMDMGTVTGMSVGIPCRALFWMVKAKAFEHPASFQEDSLVHE